MWAAAARDVSSRSPPPVSDRHLSITDSIVSTTADEIRERYRLSSFQDEPVRPPVRPIAHIRRDSMFSFNTTWTADESFMDSSGMISDFPRPPGMLPFAAPALPSSIGHGPPSAWQNAPDSARRTDGTATPSADSFPYANSPGVPQPSAYSSSSHLYAPSPTAPPPTPRNLSRPGTAPSALTVRTDARYLDPNTGAEIEVVNGSPSNSPVPSPSPGARDSMATTAVGRASVAATSIAGSGGRVSVAGSGGRASLAPSGTRHSPSSPSSQYLVPSPSSLTYTRTSPTHTQDYTYTTSRTSPTHTDDKVPGFPIAPPSPNTAAFLRSPVAPPSTHTSHEELLDPGFIRGMMRGIEHGDGLSISSEAEGPFGDRFAAPEPLFRRPPAASLPSSPRSSFSFSVRSGVGKAGWEDVPDVPPLPAAYRPGPLGSPPSNLPPTPPSQLPPSPSNPEPSTPPHEPTSPHSQAHSTQTPSQSHSTQSLRPDWSSRRRSVESRKTTVTGRSGGSGLTGITEITGTEETGVVQHAALVRTASLAERRPAVYKSTEALRSPPLEEWVSTPGGHARTTSADLAPGQEVRNRRSVQQLQFLSVTHPRTRGLPSEEVQEGDELVYVSGEELDAYRRSGYESEYGRDSQYGESLYDNRQSQYGNRQSQYGNRESQYDNRQSRYDHRGSRYPDSYLDSPYVGSWADPPSPNEVTPALRDSMINDTASYMRPGRTPLDPTHGMHSPLSTHSRFVPPFARDGYGSPSTAPATPGHGSSPLTPGYNSTPLSPGPLSAPLPLPEHNRHAKRASGTSFVSSVFSKFSGHASAGHNGKGFSFAWRNDAPPLPTPSPHVLAATPSPMVAAALTPPSPHVARMWEAKSSAAHSGGSDSTRVSAIARREGTMELPALANRADRLGEMLELGKLPYRSKSTLGASSGRVVDVPVGVDQEGNDVYPSVGDGYTDEKALRRNRSLRSVFTTISDRSRRFMGGGGQPSLRSSLVDVQGQDGQRFNKLPEEHRKIQWGEGTGVPPPRPMRSARLPKKRLWTLVAIAVIAISAIIGVAVGLRRAGRQPDAGGYTCSNTNQTGRLCDLDATCTCTSSLAGQCNPLAQSIVDLIEPINRVFNPSPAFTPASVALSIWELQGSPLAGQNCANQADLIDVGPALSFTERNSVAANRTEFARSALLWTLVMTMDTNGTAEMQDFVQGLDFTRLDGPSGSSLAGEFLFGAAGYQVDFGKLTVTQPAVTWQLAGKPSEAQVALVSSDMRRALDRVYTFASASSDQRSTALQRYWNNVLQFPAEQLAEFRTIAGASPVLLPFDATSSQIRTLFSNVNQSFPPPAACYPGLDAAELNAINAMETGVFGLSPVTSAPRSLDTSCFSSRPVYGVLDIARLRTAFPSAESGAPKQAVQVAATSVSRATVRLGRGAVGIPSTAISTANLTGSDDPRTYGTLNNMDHVLLTYLQAFPTIQAAGALVEYVLDAADARAAPPSNTSALFNLTSSLAQLPILEVAYFGTVGPSDLSLAVSDFATDDGQLFFGSSAGDAFRNWATQRAGQVAWADGPIAAQVVREGVTKDQTFEQVWDGASAFLSNAELTGTKTSRTEVQAIVDAFTRIGYMGV